MKHSTTSAPASEARQRLAHLIEARNDVTATQAAVRAGLDRLAEAKALAIPIEAEIGRLDAEETAAMARWSRDDAGSLPPTSDAAKRTELQRRLEEARAAGRAADRAEKGHNAEYHRAAATLPPIAAAIDVALAEILTEEAGLLVADVAAASQALANQAERVALAADIVAEIGRGQPDKEAAGRIFAASKPLVESFVEAARRAEPDPAVHAQHRAGWIEFIRRLRADANATIEGGA